MDSLGLAKAEAEACGVTRLADVTGLDVTGVHVFQAVRPWGRSLSVHQGKGLTPRQAKIGALMEAVEFGHAEAFVGEQKFCAFDDLDRHERAPSLLDFASDLNLPPDPSEPRPWVAAFNPVTGRTLWTPHDCVSLDYTRAGDLRLDRTSNGIGAHFDTEAAGRKALLEIIERDADRSWRASPLDSRADALIEAASIGIDWFEDLRLRLRAAGLVLTIYHLPAVISLPVLACEIFEPDAGGAIRRRSVGVGCGFSPESALLAGVLEAAQSRLTAISGVRDDIPLPDLDPGEGFGLAFPPSTASRLKQWHEVCRTFDAPAAANVRGLIDALTGAGYPNVGIIDLTRAGSGATVVKAVAPGLGAFTRARRAAVAAAV